MEPFSSMLLSQILCFRKCLKSRGSGTQWTKETKKQNKTKTKKTKQKPNKTTSKQKISSKTIL